VTETEGIAIIGMSCLFPGAPNVDAYWRNILGKVDSVTDAPPEAWDTEVYYDPDGLDTDRVYCKRGGYLGSLVSFDPLAHGIPPVAVGGEPDQWLALQVARDAMADAGCTELDDAVRQRTAVVLGKGTYLNGGNAIALEHGLIVGQTLEILKQLHPEYSPEELQLLRHAMKKSLPPMNAETVPGLIPNIIVGRIANRLDLMGPTYTVDAACASSLVAVQLALRDLRNGECDLALVGGSQVWLPVATLNVFCQLGALSREQQIRPFDKDADGTLLGEGIGMIVLKRLADAQRDGDRIYAVIRGVGVASDGRGVSVMAPRVEGEELALRRAYEAAGVSPDTIELIEAHGTGTPVGDVVEVQALTAVFGPREGELPRIALGSVKSMISHTMPAAGIAAIIKTALALHHKVLPPTLHCTEPNPKLELEKSPFYLNTETRPWIHGGREPRRAGVNAFGFGGINAHAILEEYRGIRADEPSRPGESIPAAQLDLSDHGPAWDSEVCILEAESPASLIDRASRLEKFLDSALANLSPDGADPLRLQDLAFTLNQGLTQSDSVYRLAVVASSIADLKEKLERTTRRLAEPGCRHIKDVSGIYYTAEPLGRNGKLGLLFPGEGAQYQNMLADLCLHFPEVRECFDQMDEIYHGHPRNYVLSDYVFPRPAFDEAERARAQGRLSEISGAVEAVLTANQAVFTILGRLGLRPDAIMGLSTGEFSAIRAAGILSPESGGGLPAFVHELYENYEEVASRGAVPRAVLLAVGAERNRVDAIAEEVRGDIHVAMDNCPHQVVLVGGPEAVERAIQIADREGLIHEHLNFDRAYHTPLFAPYTKHLEQVFADAPVLAPQMTVYSCATTEPYPTDPASIRSLLVDQWVRPVEFRRTVEAMYADGVRIFVEAGPRGNLSAFVEDILRGQPFCAVPANVQRRSGVTQLNHLVANLVVHGVSLDVMYLYKRQQPRHIAWENGLEALAGVRPGTRMDLATSFPMLRVPEDIASQLHQTVRSAGAPETLTQPHESPTPGIQTASPGIGVAVTSAGTYEVSVFRSQ
jgi:acyl transferase domain-containing protein